jgi:hypothetical protein
MRLPTAASRRLVVLLVMLLQLMAHCASRRRIAVRPPAPRCTARVRVEVARALNAITTHHEAAQRLARVAERARVPFDVVDARFEPAHHANTQLLCVSAIAHFRTRTGVSSNSASRRIVSHTYDTTRAAAHRTAILLVLSLPTAPALALLPPPLLVLLCDRCA